MKIHVHNASFQIGSGELNPEDVNDKLDEVYESHKAAQPAVTAHEAYREFERNLASKGGK